MAKGDELLIVDSIAAHREGMRKLFEGEGYVVSSIGSVAEARELIERKFFPVVLVDLDVDRPGAGLDLVRFIGERSSSTAVILLSGRRSFESAVQAFRLPLEMILHGLYDSGDLPVQMTWSGLNFDVVTGATAALLGLVGLRRPLSVFVWTCSW